jgi:hypothetical protein
MQAPSNTTQGRTLCAAFVVALALAVTVIIGITKIVPAPRLATTIDAYVVAHRWQTAAAADNGGDDPVERRRTLLQLRSSLNTLYDADQRWPSCASVGLVFPRSVSHMSVSFRGRSF